MREYAAEMHERYRAHLGDAAFAIAQDAARAVTPDETIARMLSEL